MLKFMYLHSAFYLSMTLFGVCALAVNFINWLLGFLPSSKRMETIVRCELHYLMRLWMWLLGMQRVVIVDWPEIEKLRKARKIVVVANHPNLLDICWILAASPHVSCIIKSSIQGNRFYNASARMAGYISNDKGLEGLHDAVDSLNNGDILAVFPEGTRTVSFPMNPFKPGFALIARQADAPIQTLYIRSNTKCFTKGVFFKPDVLPIRYELRLGPRFEHSWEETSAREARAVESAMRSDLESGGMWK